MMHTVCDSASLNLYMGRYRREKMNPSTKMKRVGEDKINSVLSRLPPDPDNGDRASAIVMIT